MSGQGKMQIYFFITLKCKSSSRPLSVFKIAMQMAELVLVQI